MNVELSWWIALPILLSLLYGYTSSRSKSAMSMSISSSWAGWLLHTLVAAALVLSWSLVGYPLPLFYLLVYLLQAMRMRVFQSAGIRGWFFVNVACSNYIALHLTLIGTAALIRSTTLYALVQQPFWRAMTISAVLLIAAAQDLCFLLWPNFSNTLQSLAESEEAKPFMAFLWFCVGYLLIDSTLCVFPLEPLYPPLFLIGSNSMVMFALIRFLLNINTLIKNDHLKVEHDRLSSRLEATQESADMLKQMAQRDVLTRAFSRRFAMERVDAMIQAQESFALVFIDLDALKQVNDTLGHDAGDDLLIRFADTLQGRLRDRDLLARVGGDEFIVLMPGCAADTAAQRIQRIRQEMEQTGQAGPPLRFSYGVAALQGAERDAHLLIREADRAMYRDKMRRRQREGRW